MIRDDDSHAVNQAVETMIAFLKQSKLVVLQPSVTRSRTAGICSIMVDGFYVNPKVYLCHPKSKKKLLVKYPEFFLRSHSTTPALFYDVRLTKMVGKANVGMYWPSTFWEKRDSHVLNAISCAIVRKMIGNSIFKQFRDEAQREWDRCKHEKRTLLSGYFSNSKKRNKIRGVFHEQLSNFLANADSARALDVDTLIKLFQIDAKELVQLADFVKKNQKELRFVENKDIESALETSQVKHVMTK